MSNPNDLFDRLDKLYTLIETMLKRREWLEEPREYLEDFVISAIVKPDNPDWAEPFFKSITKRGWLVFIDDE